MAAISYYRMIGFGNEKVIFNWFKGARYFGVIFIQLRDDGRGKIQDGRQSILSKGLLYLIVTIERPSRCHFQLI